MPRALEPNVINEFSLDCDIDKPIESRPVFLFRCVSSRVATATEAVVDGIRADTIATADEGRDKLVYAIGVYLVGWRNMIDADGTQVTYSLDKLRDIVTDLELWQLYYGLKNGGHVSLDDKKKSESQP